MSSPERPSLETIGRYVLGPALGEGGQGKVQLGLALGAGEVRIPVAIKRLTDNASTRAIVEEAAKLARVQHANVVAPIDVLESSSGAILVMELVHGISCDRIRALSHAADRRVPLAIAAKIATDMLAGLHALHEARDPRGEPLEIVHRDVTPDNVLASEDGVARLIDLGIAKAAHAARTTTVGLIRGKAAYLAPELLSGAAATRRSDVFAAGRVIQDLFTAPGGAVLDDDKACPSDLRALVRRACDPAPDRRPATALAVSEALERAVPLASARAVAAYVAELGGEELERQRRMLAAMLAALPRSVSAGVINAPRGRAIVTMTLVASLAGAAGWLVHTTLPATSAAQAEAKGTPSALAVAPSPNGPVAPTAAASTASTPLALGSAPADTATSGARRAPSPSRALSAAAVTSAPATKTAGGLCDPPFLIDDAGHTIFKRECLR